MRNEAFLSLLLSAFFYLAAFFLHVRVFLRSDSFSEKTAFILMRVAFACATVYLVFEAWAQGIIFPIVNFAHVLAFFAWALAFVYILLLARLESQSFGLILAPVLFGLTVASLMRAGDPIYSFEAQIYFALHIIFAFFAYASFTLSFTAAWMYLIQHRELKLRHPGTFYQKLPNLETLDHMTYQPMIFGIVLLVAAVAVGMLWLKDSSGQLWLNDPKTFLTFITLGLYGMVISLRYATSMRNSRLALLSILVFAFMIFSFAAGRHINSKHGSAAKGNTAVGAQL